MNEASLRDIRPPLLLPEPPDYLLITVVAVGGMVILGLLIWLLKYRKKKVDVPGYHETALAELVALRKLMTREEAPRYATKVADVLRTYIEQRFQIPSSRQTTREFFQALDNDSIDTAMLVAQHTERLKECLTQCDMAKFAKSIPNEQSMEQMETAVRQFIETTAHDGTRGE